MCNAPSLCCRNRRIVVVVMAIAAFVTVMTANAGAEIDFPSPLTGPGVETVKKSHRKKIDRAWRELEAGNLNESAKKLARGGQGAPARLLGYQLRLVKGDLENTDELLAFCKGHPEYAAAWVTLSIAAERLGSEIDALDAARRGSDLWAAQPWGERAAKLERRWIDDRVVRATTAVDNGDFNSARVELEAIQALDPDRPDCALLEARIAVSTDQLDRATEILGGIPSTPETILLTGSIAEIRGDWQTAMENYAALPEEHPHRMQALQRAQTRWRMTLLPTYAQAAIQTESLTRGDLAVILVSVHPRLETLPGGEVPVMSDIVDQPGQREIISVVRLGIMTADRRARVFYPDRPANIETVQEAIRRTKALLGLPAPIWCAQEDVLGSDCTSLPLPLGGGTVVAAVTDPTSGAVP